MGRGIPITCTKKIDWMQQEEREYGFIGSRKKVDVGVECVGVKRTKREEEGMSELAEGYTQDFPVSWPELHRDARALAWRLKDVGPFEGLVSVTRGGLVPSAIVSRELNIRMIDSISVASYDERAQSKVEVLKGVNEVFLKTGGEGLVVVDDLTDTGATFARIKELLPHAHYATIYAKPAGRPYADTYVTEVSQATWILFPWDVEMTYAQPLVR